MMYALQPVNLAPVNIVSSTAVEQHSAWVAGSYSNGERRTLGQSVWESLVDTNTSEPGTDPAKWIRVGPTNVWAMFDKSVNTVTTATEELSVTVAPGVVTNALGFANLQGAQLEVTVRDGPAGPVFFQKTESLDGTILSDWYDYFFAPFDFRTEVVMTDVPPYSTAHIEAKITGGGEVGVGAMIVGSAHEIGDVLHDAGFGINDYSQAEEDKWGNIELTEGNYTRSMDLQVMVRNTRLHYVTRLLARLRQTPTLWIGSKDPRYQPLIIFGFVKSWRAAIPYPNESLIDIQIRGMNDVI